MEKSINTIWKEGFKKEELNIPEHSILHQKKSKLILEKLKRTYKTDNQILLPLGIFIGGFLTYTHSVLLGVYTFGILISLYFYNRKLLNSLAKIDIQLNNYEYLVTYKKGINRIKIATGNLLTIGFPVAILTGLGIYFKNNSVFLNFIEHTHKSYLIIGFLLGFLIIISFGHLAYYISSKVLYNNELKKIENLITDLKELQT